ncbi:hypothetical protein D3C76_956730 [compost metagenome]
MALTTATSLGWMILLLPLGTILPLAVATTSISPTQAQISASTAKAMMVHWMIRGAGCTGASCNARAAGRNCTSWFSRAGESMLLRRCQEWRQALR